MAGRGDAAELGNNRCCMRSSHQDKTSLLKVAIICRRASETKPTSVPETANPGGPHSFNWFPVPSHREEPGRVRKRRTTLTRSAGLSACFAGSGDTNTAPVSRRSRGAYRDRSGRPRDRPAMASDQVARRFESDAAQSQKQPHLGKQLKFAIEKAGAVGYLFGEGLVIGRCASGGRRDEYFAQRRPSSRDSEVSWFEKPER